jgi:hypothetical protein
MIHRMYPEQLIAPALVVGGLAAFAAWRIIRDGNENELHKRRMLGRRYCCQCGYDVHASTGRRPECGTEIPWRQGRRHR